MLWRVLVSLYQVLDFVFQCFVYLSKNYLVEGTHKVLITIQNSVDQLNKFTMYLQNWLHKLSWHLKRVDTTESKLARKVLVSKTDASTLVIHFLLITLLGKVTTTVIFERMNSAVLSHYDARACLGNKKSRLHLQSCYPT